jgi:hypothetical protein
VLRLKIAKKSENGQNGLPDTPIDREMNGEQFIPACRPTLSGDFYEIIDFKVYRNLH